jgi:LPS export ABC transporter permease LptF/LPS export ABC transporter permease LptG
MAGAHDTVLTPAAEPDVGEANVAGPLNGRRRSSACAGRFGGACYDRSMSLLSGLALSRPRLIDRYIVREMLAPTGIGLLVFTFVLLIDQIPRLLAVLVARSADLPTILRVFLNLLPSILAITIPMAFLLGVLLAFGRMASDSEIVALRAVGVSPLRLLSPVLMLALVMAALTFYINAVALPAANQAHRELVFSLVVSKARTDVKPRTFTDDLLPGRMMLYVQDIEPGSGLWKNLLIHDTRDIAESKLILARSGALVIDRERHVVRVELGPGSQHSFFGAEPRAYNRTSFSSMGWDLPVDEFFPDRQKLLLAKGDREMSLPELGDKITELRGQNRPRAEWGRFAVEWHKKFAIPAACLVFGLLGLALSLGSRKEARSSAFALSIAVIFVYYVLIRLGEQAGDTGALRPWLAMWGANLVLGAIALTLLYLNHREAAFDPLDPSHYRRFVPEVRRRHGGKAGRAPAAPAARPRPVVVVRIPRLSLRFPSLLDRYIARAWVGNVLLVMLAFAAVYFLADFMDLIDDFQHNRVPGRVVVRYYAFHAFQILFTVTPVAVLVGALVTLGVLARNKEITAMKAGGISVYRATLPVLGMGLVASLLLYGTQEWVLPETNKAASAERNVIKGRPAQSSDQFDRRWMLAGEGRFYNFDYILERAPASRPGLAERGRDGEFSVYGFSIYDVDPARWELRERLFATRASWNAAERAYELERGFRRTTGERTAFRPFLAQRVRATGGDPGGEIEPPQYFKREEKPSDTMGFAELRGYIRSLSARGFDVARLSVQLQRKIAFPMVGLVMTLLAVPFSFVVARRGALYGIGVAIVIAIVYWAVLGIFEALGNNAALHPALAAWAPNLIFGATGLYLIFTLET